MLKFVKDHLDTIAGVEIYPIISLIIFFLFFVGLTIWVATAKKEYIKTVSNLPLESDDTNQNAIKS